MAVAEKPKAFRFQGTRVHLTYKTHLVKEEFIAWCKEELGTVEVHIAHETGHEDTPYPHSHCILEWGSKAYQTRNVRKFDYKEIHPNIKPITSREHLERCYKYLAKEDQTCGYLLTKKSTAFSKRIWSCRTLDEALATVDGPSEVLGTIAMFNAKPKPAVKPRLIEHMRPWQEKVMRIISEPPDDRHILWVLDETGGTGKSRLAAHIEDSGLGIAFSGTASTKDIAHILKKEIDAGGPLGVIIIDLSRSFKDRDIYNALECLKNGRMTAGKYDSSRIAWNPGHVVVFANFPPERGAFSRDRIIIMDLGSYSEAPDEGGEMP